MRAPANHSRRPPRRPSRRGRRSGLYASRGRGFVTPDVALDTMVMTRRGVERVCRKDLRAPPGPPAAPSWIACEPEGGRVVETCEAALAG